jgi:hypothetical protein
MSSIGRTLGSSRRARTCSSCDRASCGRKGNLSFVRLRAVLRGPYPPVAIAHRTPSIRTNTALPAASDAVRAWRPERRDNLLPDGPRLVCCVLLLHGCTAGFSGLSHPAANARRALSLRSGWIHVGLVLHGNPMNTPHSGQVIFKHRSSESVGGGLAVRVTGFARRAIFCCFTGDDPSLR